MSNQPDLPLLSAVVFLPLFGGVLALLLGANRRAIRFWALGVSLADLGLAVALWALFDYGRSGFQFADTAQWIEPLGIRYSVGLDGINLWLVLLTSLLGVIALGLSWRFLNTRAESEAGPYAFLLLALESGALGVFASMDLVLFFIFWEAMLVPAYFLIARWGGDRRTQAGREIASVAAEAGPAARKRTAPAGKEPGPPVTKAAGAAQRAALKFLLYTMAGSALMLVAIISLAVLHYNDTGVLTFQLSALYENPLPQSAQLWLLLAFLLAFAVKAPIWPLHSWLGDAYVEAPAPVTVMLAGVLSKMGIYGMIRLCLPLFPNALEAVRPWVLALAVVGILYGSLVALAQRDMKRLVAFSSLAHMGLIFAGVLAANVQGVQGAILQSASHGVTVAGLFLLVDFLEARRGTRLIEHFGGLWKSVPLLGTIFLTVILAAIGLPGLSGFPGEFTILVGLFQKSVAAAVFAALGLVLGAWYLLNLFRQAFAGPLAHPENRTLGDLRRREAALILPIVILIFVVGLAPNVMLRPTDTAVNQLLDRAEARRVVLMVDSQPRAVNEALLQAGPVTPLALAQSQHMAWMEE